MVKPQHYQKYKRLAALLGPDPHSPRTGGAQEPWELCGCRLASEHPGLLQEDTWNSFSEKQLKSMEKIISKY
ncbi:hypothetical protein AAY473_002256 [Plecturocebus cupreus]